MWSIKDPDGDLVEFSINCWNPRISKPLHTLSIQPEMGGQGLHHSAISRMAGGLSLSQPAPVRPLSPFRICMFIPSRAFAYLPLSPPPDRAVP